MSGPRESIDDELDELIRWLDPDGTILATLRAPKGKAAPLAVPLAGHSPADLPPLAKRIGRALKYLARMPAAIEGQDGSGATYAAATALVHGFCLDEHSALSVLLDAYNPRCVPPWSESELRHKVADAATKTHTRERGWLLAGRAAPTTAPALPAPTPTTSEPAARQLATLPLVAYSDGLSPDGAGLNESDDNEHRLARAVVAPYTSAGRRTLAYWQGDFHSWDGVRYVTHAPNEFRPTANHTIRRELEAAQRARLADHDWSGEKQPPAMPKVTSALVTNVLQGVEGSCRLLAVPESPAWIRDARGADPTEIVVAQNGLVHLPAYAAGHKDAIAPHTPYYFSFNSVGYAVNAAAPSPREWLRFVESLWPGDEPQAQHLAEWMGYLLTPDRSQQKMLLLVGASGSGKGTIARVIRQLVGAGNCAAPTVDSLSGEFGVAPLIGKSVAIFGDAKFDKKTPMATLTGRIMNITGEDVLTINRKNRDHFTARLNTRFVMLANDMPDFGAAAREMTRRWSILTFSESFIGREDTQLDRKLQAELPGIFNWAVEGWTRFKARGHFAETEAGREVADEMLALGSPVSAFVKSRCRTGAMYTTPMKPLFDEWKRYCGASNILDVGSVNRFARDIRACVPSLRTCQLREDGTQTRVYRGIDVRPGTGASDRLAHERDDDQSPAELRAALGQSSMRFGETEA